MTLTTIFEPEICEEGGHGSLLPASDSEWETNSFLRGLMYGVAMVYFFLGISIVSDTFMGAIEMITSRKRQQLMPSGRVLTVHIWNDTVANLTLMALGSSAPEILLAVTELFGKRMYAGDLGPATIVGSASFNLLMIVALCIVIIPSTETRKVAEVPVFFTTVVFMVIAYVWLVVMVGVWTPEIVTIWEALITLALLPILVLMSYWADVGFFGEAGKTLEIRSEDVERVCELIEDYTREAREAIRKGLAENHDMLGKLAQPTAQDLGEIRKIVKKHRIGRRKSRATHRIEATRAMTGGKKILWETEPRANDMVHISGLTGACIQDVPLALPKGQGKCHLQFSAEVQQMSDNLSEKSIMVHRSGDLSAEITCEVDVLGPPPRGVPLARPSGDSSTRPSVASYRSTRSVSVISSLYGATRHSSRNSFGSARSGSMISGMSGSSALWVTDSQRPTFTFAPGQDVAQVVVRRPDGVMVDSNTCQFLVESLQVLDGEKDDEIIIGTIDRTLIVMCEDYSMGRLNFPYDRLLIQGSDEKQIIQVMVQRSHGCYGTTTCAWRTERLSAMPGFDYTEAEGTLQFDNGVTELFIEIEILQKATFEAGDNFLLVLEAAEGADFDPESDGGADSTIMTIEIGPKDLMASHFSARMVMWFDERFNFDELRLGSAEYKEQMISAVYCNGSKADQQEAEMADRVFHLIALPWKLIFMLIPPPVFCGGWFCFVASLLCIAGLTAFIGDLAALFGCVVGMPSLLTAISFVALGTSMPDLFASMSAATQDPTADASIVNVTGSNSVNVFLGLGLPWTIGSIYWHVRDWDETWAQKYPDIIQDYGLDNQMVFVVRSGDLAFSVCLFCVCGILAITMLLIRRRKIGAELGGPLSFKLTSSVAFVFEWISYVGLSGWWSLRKNKADTPEKTAVFVIGGAMLFIPFLIFLAAASKIPPQFVSDTEAKLSVKERTSCGTRVTIEVEDKVDCFQLVKNTSAVAAERQSSGATERSVSTERQSSGASVRVSDIDDLCDAMAATPHAPPHTQPLKYDQKEDSLEGVSVASESHKHSRCEDIAAIVPTTSTSLDTGQTSCLCFDTPAPGAALQKPVPVQIGIVDVQQIIGADGIEIQQFLA